MTFHGETVSPPETYLSESHLNCLGICLFLASAIAFNKINRYIVLDDVISSFDTTHRIKFGHLLRERFSDFQVLVFTHEITWFEYMTNLVKGDGWSIRKVVWDHDAGVTLKPVTIDLRSAIRHRLANSDIEGLGNEIRTHLESLLKKICVNLKVKLTFLYNDRNEDRMVGEMLSALISTLKKHNCELKDEFAVHRIGKSLNLVNKLSHDSSFNPTAGDLNALWDEVDEFEQLFECDKCSRIIETNGISTTGIVSCRCGALEYAWNE